MLTDRELDYIELKKPDFVFLYMAKTDDKGGRDRIHGTELHEDMTIPMFFIGEDFLPGEELTDVSILDIALTVAHVMGITPPREWEGKNLIR